MYSNFYFITYHFHHVSLLTVWLFHVFIWFFQFLICRWSAQILALPLFLIFCHTKRFKLAQTKTQSARVCSMYKVMFLRGPTQFKTVLGVQLKKLSINHLCCYSIMVVVERYSNREVYRHRFCTFNWRCPKIWEPIIYIG